jgi:hypothetical protein
MYGVMVALAAVAALRMFGPVALVIVAALSGRTVEIDGPRISFPARSAARPRREK